MNFFDISFKIIVLSFILRICLDHLGDATKKSEIQIVWLFYTVLFCIAWATLATADLLRGVFNQ